MSTHWQLIRKRSRRRLWSSSSCRLRPFLTTLPPIVSSVSRLSRSEEATALSLYIHITNAGVIYSLRWFIIHVKMRCCFMTIKPLKKRCLSDVDITAIAVFLTLTSLGDHPLFLRWSFVLNNHRVCRVGNSQLLYCYLFASVKVTELTMCLFKICC